MEAKILEESTNSQGQTIRLKRLGDDWLPFTHQVGKYQSGQCFEWENFRTAEEAEKAFNALALRVTKP